MTVQSSGSAIRFSNPYILLVVFLLFLANVINYGHRLLLSILLPQIEADIGLTDTEAGILMGGIFAVCYAIAGVPLARLADRYVRKTFIAGALLFWSVLTGLMGFVGSFVQMALIRVGVGIGEAICIPCSHSLISDYVPVERRASAFALHSAGSVVGITASLMVGGYLGALIGWRMTFMVMAIPGILVGLLIFLVMREPPRGYSDGATGLVEQPRLPDVVRHLVTKRTYLLVVLGVCFGMLVEFGTNQWLPSFYVRQYGMTLDQVGLKYGLAVAVGGVPGSILGGLLTDRLIKIDLRWMLWLPSLLYLLAIPVGLAMLGAESADAALMINAAYAFLIMATNGPFWSAVFILVPSSMRATTSAITLMIGGIVGLAMGPVLVGLISDNLTASLGEAALQESLRIVIMLAATVIVSLGAASFFLKREYAEVHSQPLASAAPATES